MKKIQVVILFAAIFVLGITKTSFSQGNLQFNQVMVIDLAANGTQAIVVPAGKVWKIESVSIGSSSTSPSVFLRNAGGIYIAHFAAPASTSSAAYPYWLPSAFVGTFVNLHPSLRCSVSIIEFNVVP